MKIGLIQLGCPKNLVDGEVMLGYAREAGHEITADAREADVIVVNTCAFIDAAREESVDAILEMAELKRQRAGVRLVVTGCLGERYRGQLQAEIPEVDVVLGTGEIPGIVDAITAATAAPPAVHPVRFVRPTRSTRSAGPSPNGNAPSTPSAFPPTYLYDACSPRLITTPSHFAYVKVAEGCDYTCAFCIIPTLRGAYRSRTEDSIVAEAESLAARGVRELLLISQDTTFFGIDRGERGALARLLRRLDAVDGLTWIRLLYLYPTTITDEVLGAMADSARVCAYIDLPLQHASADVLRRMRRPGNRATYDTLLSRIRRHLPDVTLRTTFIVGFPGETARDVAELEGFIADTGFDHVGVFTYSHEEDTRAYALADDVPAEVKRERRDGVMALQRDLVRRRNASRIGRPLQVLVDGPSPDSPLVVVGRHAGQAPDIDSVVYLTECDPTAFGPGDLVETVVTEARDYDLVARPT
ncbi:MAG TPA: 30S ribosomal protein S12 methylthiotransferase RimO [Vicinamibacterales bacterium]|nr:30S ribosomal protein S12 methylthiotransferase RimO [Vicinamibacterales bacterium]